LNVIHRDLKPDNVFKQKTKNGSIYKLGDFGLAVAKTKDNQTAGTAPYMAPEMINGDSYGIEIDIFSLGCVAHQILFG
jgi:calcium/calmodulin-dependent protein kinase I